MSDELAAWVREQQRRAHLASMPAVEDRRDYSTTRIDDDGQVTFNPTDPTPTPPTPTDRPAQRGFF